MGRTIHPSRLSIENGAVVVATPYDPALVASIKGLPASERKYNPTRKVWLVDPKHAPTIAHWIEAFLGETVPVPELKTTYQSRITQRLTVRYVGSCKPRSDGGSSAYGLLGLGGSNWNVIFPEQVLRDFFGGSLPTPGEAESYFSLLGISQAATAEEVTKGFRRMAMIWHPDHCAEEAAADIFIRIKTAYDVLKDPDTRARYEAGLAFQALLREPEPSVLQRSYGYRAPLRSGMILIEGYQKFSMIEVEKILSWEDIVDGQGRVLIVSWPAGAKDPVEEWL